MMGDSPLSSVDCQHFPWTFIPKSLGQSLMFLNLYIHFIEVHLPKFVASVTNKDFIITNYYYQLLVLLILLLLLLFIML